MGPDFRFYNTYRVVDDKGKVLGYKNLAQLRIEQGVDNNGEPLLELYATGWLAAPAPNSFLSPWNNGEH